MTKKCLASLLLFGSGCEPRGWSHEQIQLHQIDQRRNLLCDVDRRNPPTSKANGDRRNQPEVVWKWRSAKGLEGLGPSDNLAAKRTDSISLLRLLDRTKLMFADARIRKRGIYPFTKGF